MKFLRRDFEENGCPKIESEEAAGGEREGCRRKFSAFYGNGSSGKILTRRFHLPSAGGGRLRSLRMPADLILENGYNIARQIGVGPNIVNQMPKTFQNVCLARLWGSICSADTFLLIDIVGCPWCGMEPLGATYTCW